MLKIFVENAGKLWNAPMSPRISTIGLISFLAINSEAKRHGRQITVGVESFYNEMP